jgi:putative membrane protein
MKIQKIMPMKNKVLSIILVVMMTFTYVLTSAEVCFAAAPSVMSDETVYVNMDYYGIPENVSIVKGCDLNGIKTFTDYGNYLSVTNMTGYDKPSLTAGGVTWNLKDFKGQRFYYSCALNKQEIEFPWIIDVSYKLNGVPEKAENLAGVSGLVEIDIKIAPNEKAKEYARNNMLLQVGTNIDMEDNYSIEAPGSQLQTIGSKKIVMFMALPGEEETYMIRIGTNSFETDGITAMMAPGTAEELKNIKDLKEARDDVKDASNDIYIAMNQMLLTMGSMDGGLRELKLGTQGADDARRHFSAGDDEMYEDFDQTIEDLNAVNSQLEDLIPYFETGQRMIRSINGDMNKLSQSLEDLENPLDDTKSSISTVNGDLSDLKKMLGTLNNQMGKMIQDLAAAASTPYESAEVQGDAAMATTLSEHMDSLNSLINETIEMGDTAKKMIDITNDLTDETVDLTDTLDNYEDDMIDMLDDMEELTALTNSSLNSTIVLMNYSKNLMQETGNIMDPAMEKTLKGMIDLLDKSISNMDDISAMLKANTTIKETVDNQFDKFEDENKFLNLDAEAPLQSFTSDKNPAPLSAQILVRTAEISLDKAGNNSDLESPKQNKGILGRILDVFKKIRDKIASLF